MQVNRLAVALIGLCMMASHHQGPNVPLLDDFSLSTATCVPPVSCYLAAPIILIGTVSDVRPLVSARPAAREPDVLLDLVTIEVSIEHVLKGKLRGDRVSVLGFVYSSMNKRTLGLPPFSPAPGERRLFFLREEAGHLRLFRDVFEAYYVRIYSGAHAGIDRTALTKPQQLAWLLLTPGSNFLAESFALNLPHYVYVSTEAAGQAYVLRLLKKLTEFPDSRIRTEALELQRSYSRGRSTSKKIPASCTRCPGAG